MATILIIIWVIFYVIPAIGGIIFAIIDLIEYRELKYFFVDLVFSLYPFVNIVI